MHVHIEKLRINEFQVKQFTYILFKQHKAKTLHLFEVFVLKNKMLIDILANQITEKLESGLEIESSKLFRKFFNEENYSMVGRLFI